MSKRIDAIDVITLEDERERQVIEGAKAIMRSFEFGYNVDELTDRWFIDAAAMQAAEYLVGNADALVDPPSYDPLMAHFQAGDLIAAERHLLTKWGIKPRHKPLALEQ